MECQIQISVKVAKRLKKQLGTGGQVDIQQLCEPSDKEDVFSTRILVYHKNYMKIVDDFFGEDSKLKWMHNGKPYK